MSSRTGDALPTGPFTRADLRACGLPGDRAATGLVRTISRDVHLRADASPATWRSLGYECPPSPLPPEETAALVAASRGVASHLTALLLHGVPLPPWLVENGTVHVTRPHAKGVSRRFGVTTHGRGLTAADVTELHGVRVTGMERTWADLASLLAPGLTEPVVAAGDALVTPPWTPDGRLPARTTTAALRSALERAGRFKGVRTARAALDLVRVGADSPQETALRLALLHAGLPEPELQLVLDPRRPRSPDADLGWRELRLVIHYDGAHHLNPEQRAVDAWRDDGWRRAGWAQIWATVDDAQEDFRRVVAEAVAHRARLGGWRYAVA